MDTSILYSEDIEKIRDCLEKSVEMINEVVNFNTPLMFAITKERTDIIDLLIEYGCDVNYMFFRTALHHLFETHPDNHEILQKLINAKADCSIPDTLGCIPLYIAAASTKDVNVIHRLILYSNPNVGNKIAKLP